MIATVTLNPSLDKTLSFETLSPADVNRVLRVRLDPGGKGINVSRVIHALGGETVAYGFLGGGTGEKLAPLLPCPADWVWVEEETRENLLLSAADGTSLKVNFPGPTISPAACSALREKLFNQSPSFLVLSGSIPPGLSPGCYRELIEEAHTRGLRTVLDADGLALVEGVRAHPTMLKVNRQEFSRLVGPLEDEASLLAAAQALLAQGLAAIVVSDGGAPAYLLTRQDAWKAYPPPIEVLSAVGAGDALLAGMLYSLDGSAPWPEAFRFGVASGAAAVLVPGTGIPSPARLRTLHAAVMIEALRR